MVGYVSSGYRSKLKLIELRESECVDRNQFSCRSKNPRLRRPTLTGINAREVEPCGICYCVSHTERRLPRAAFPGAPLGLRWIEQWNGSQIAILSMSCRLKPKPGFGKDRSRSGLRR